MNKVIGIDLGTTYSAISQWLIKRNGVRESKAYNITLEGSSVCPSKVYVEKTEYGLNFVVGSSAEGKGILKPSNFVTAVKRMMDNNKPIILDAGTFTPVEISSEILKFLLGNVVAQEGPTWVPGGVVVTVPHYFKENQKENTRLAAKKALKELFDGKLGGIRYNNRALTSDDLLLGVVSEPVAAGLDYVLNSDEDIIDGKYFVFDLGGGTFDVTIFKITSENENIEFEVLATDGLSRLGGEDFDESLLKWVLEDEGINLDGIKNKKAVNVFLKDARPKVTQCKETLSAVEKSDLIITVRIGDIPFVEKTISRNDLKRCMNGEEGSKIDFLSKISNKIDDVFGKANISLTDIKATLLTGGSSKMLAIKEVLVNKIEKEKIRNTEAVDLAVSKGAAIYAAYMMDKINVGNNNHEKYINRWKNIHIKERSAHDLGIIVGSADIPRFRKLIAGNSLLPCQALILLNPIRLSGDGSKVLPATIKIAQGVPSNYDIVGTVTIDESYTHGRRARNIKISFTANLTGDKKISVTIKIPKGNQDETDMIVTKDITIVNSNN